MKWTRLFSGSYSVVASLHERPFTSDEPLLKIYVNGILISEEENLLPVHAGQLGKRHIPKIY